MYHDYFSFSQIAIKLHEVSNMKPLRYCREKSLPIYTCNFHREVGRDKNLHWNMRSVNGPWNMSKLQRNQTLAKSSKEFKYENSKLHDVTCIIYCWKFGYINTTYFYLYIATTLTFLQLQHSHLCYPKQNATFVKSRPSRWLFSG